MYQKKSKKWRQRRYDTKLNVVSNLFYDAIYEGLLGISYDVRWTLTTKLLKLSAQDRFYNLE